MLHRVGVDGNVRDRGRPRVVELVDRRVQPLVCVEEAVEVVKDNLLHRHPDCNVAREVPRSRQDLHVEGALRQERAKGEGHKHGTKDKVQADQRHGPQELSNVQALVGLDLPLPGAHECWQGHERAEAPECYREDERASHKGELVLAVGEERRLQSRHPRWQQVVHDELLHEQESDQGRCKVAKGRAQHVAPEEGIRDAAGGLHL
mmetsp:Transcript_30670/g.69730  ORF Transcript_30670/g.69730 Transcript_30670/m.69730 type:complete len:205 (-) Transcript_30670:71-685(-)